MKAKQQQGRVRSVAVTESMSISGHPLSGDVRTGRSGAGAAKAGERIRRITIGLDAGVHEALANVAERSGLRPGDVAREALRCYEPLLAECRRLDRGRL